MEEMVDLKRFIELMQITHVTALKWINEGRVKAERKKIAFNRFKYLIPLSEVERIKALRN